MKLGESEAEGAPGVASRGVMNPVSVEA